MINKQEQLGNEFIKSSGGVEMPSNIQELAYYYSDQPEDQKEIGYGYMTKNELAKNLYTNDIYDPRELKGVFKDGMFKSRVSRHYAVIPDEAVEELQQPLIDSGELKFIQKFHNHGGLSTTWEFETPKTFQVTKSADKDDVFGVRVIFRNSINSSTALSASLRTLRLLCTNGLTGWGMDFQNKIAHYGKIEEKLAVFRANVNKVTEMTERAMALYERTTEIATSKEIVKYIVNKIPYLSKQYIPTWINVEEGKRGVKFLGINESKAPKTLYEVTNDFTYILSRAIKTHPEHNKINGELSFLSVTGKEQALTKAVQRIVVNKGRVPQ